MIIGAHSVVSSTNPESGLCFPARRTQVDGGYLIFGLPPAEVSVHASDKNNAHEFYLMCDDVKAFIAEMEVHSIVCDTVQDQGWGLVTRLTLPGGGKLGVYEPRHARPKPMTAKTGGPKPQAKPKAF